MTAITRTGDAGSPVTLDAIALLKADHHEVKVLFASFKKANDEAQGRIAAEICAALTVHAQIEEEIFYPVARAALGTKGADLLDEALVEHGSAKDLIAKIEAFGPDRPLFRAWVRVLGEYIQHHVKEEESELFTELRSSEMDLRALGAKLATRRAELTEAFVRDSAKLPGAASSAGPATRAASQTEVRRCEEPGATVTTVRRASNQMTSKDVVWGRTDARTQELQRGTGHGRSATLCRRGAGRGIGTAGERRLGIRTRSSSSPRTSCYSGGMTIRLQCQRLG